MPKEIDFEGAPPAPENDLKYELQDDIKAPEPEHKKQLRHSFCSTDFSNSFPYLYFKYVPADFFKGTIRIKKCTEGWKLPLQPVSKLPPTPVFRCLS